MPQQNGTVERKNQTILSMVRSVLTERGVSRLFWPEAVNWVVHILNRSRTLAVKNITPEEAWCRIKPSVSYFRIFGCIGYVHVPYQKKNKLDDKSIKCVVLGVSEESKPTNFMILSRKKILISKDVKFQEDAAWDWGEAKTNIVVDTNELNPMEESCQEVREIIQKCSNDTTSIVAPNSIQTCLILLIQELQEPQLKGGLENHHHG